MLYAIEFQELTGFRHGRCRQNFLLGAGFQQFAFVEIQNLVRNSPGLLKTVGHQQQCAAGFPDILQNQPFILQFITSAWEETSPEVADTLAILTEETSRFRNDLVLREEDALKFKDPEDAQPVFQMLLLMAEGYAARYRGAAAFDFQAVMEDFEKNIAILRKNFYKEEYLK